MLRRHFPLGILAVLVFLTGTARSVAAPANDQFLIVSDIHFNPFADPSVVANLAAAPANRWEPILNRSHATSYSPYGQDTNWPLLQSALDAVRTTEPHPALLMITGDLLAHGFPRAYAGATHDTDPAHYRAFVLKTVTFLAWELRRRFPKTQILLTPGNNDDECGDYQIQADGPFLNDTAALARALARGSGSFIADWRALGSYAVRPRNVRGVRILSVTPSFFPTSIRRRILPAAARCLTRPPPRAPSPGWKLLSPKPARPIKSMDHAPHPSRDRWLFKHDAIPAPAGGWCHGRLV